MKKGKTIIREITGLVIAVFAMVFSFASMAAAEDNFKVCVKAETISNDVIDYILYGEANDSKEGVLDVNGIGSFTGMVSVGNFDFLVSGTASTVFWRDGEPIRGEILGLALNGQTIEGDNQITLFMSASNMSKSEVVGDVLSGSFIAGLTVTDFSPNPKPTSRYKLEGIVQTVPCE